MTAFDVIQKLTELKLKHGNLPVHIIITAKDTASLSGPPIRVDFYDTCKNIKYENRWPSAVDGKVVAIEAFVIE